jgi:hypothetical protein
MNWKVVCLLCTTLACATALACAIILRHRPAAPASSLELHSFPHEGSVLVRFDRHTGEAKRVFLGSSGS